MIKEARSIRVAVVLPAYNEELTIASTIEAFQAQYADAEIFVINNNSSDRTESIARETLARIGAKGGVINEPRQGKGNAVRRAFMRIEADVYVLADADMTYPAEAIHELIAPVASGQADMVVGDRRSGGHYAKENKRAFHGFGNWLVQWLVNRMFSSTLVDIMSGYRVFSRTFVKTYPILVEGFQIETDLTLHALYRRLRVVEIPVEYRDRPDGSESKLSTFSDGARVLFTIAQILRYYRPLTFFGSLAIGFGIAGIVASFPVMSDWFRFHYIYHVPLAILATGFEIAAMLSLGVGLILDAIAHKDRADFERHLLSMHRDVNESVQ